MIWLTRRYEGSPLQRNAIQNRFEVLFKANGSPEEMLLVEENHSPHSSTLWLRLPDTRYRTAFGELVEGNEADLPKSAALVVGHNAEFESLFTFEG